MILKSSQKKYLKGLAHSLKPLVYIGLAGVESNLIKAIEENLLAHELIKIKFIKLKEEKNVLLELIQIKTKATLVGLIGNVAILYKQHKEPDKRKIKFEE